MSNYLPEEMPAYFIGNLYKIHGVRPTLEEARNEWNRCVQVQQLQQQLVLMGPPGFQPHSADVPFDPRQPPPVYQFPSMPPPPVPPPLQALPQDGPPVFEAQKAAKMNQNQRVQDAWQRSLEARARIRDPKIQEARVHVQMIQKAEKAKLAPPTNLEAPPTSQEAPPTSPRPSQQDGPLMEKAGNQIPVDPMAPPTIPQAPPTIPQAPPTIPQAPPISLEAPPTDKLSPPITRDTRFETLNLAMALFGANSKAPPTRMETPPIKLDAPPTKLMAPLASLEAQSTSFKAPLMPIEAPPTKKKVLLTKMEAPPPGLKAPPTKPEATLTIHPASFASQGSDTLEAPPTFPASLETPPTISEAPPTSLDSSQDEISQESPDFEGPAPQIGPEGSLDPSEAWDLFRTPLMKLEFMRTVKLAQTDDGNEMRGRLTQQIMALNRANCPFEEIQALIRQAKQEAKEGYSNPLVEYPKETLKRKAEDLEKEQAKRTRTDA
uniref:C3H1-type domain-containing protein n=1 Tax=Caenorhabditis tropicalis TaxID=1561998 RepID=A0A1I7UGW6_9PELO